MANPAALNATFQGEASPQAQLGTLDMLLAPTLTTLLVGVATAIAAFYILIQPKKQKLWRDIPGPTPLPLFGNLIDLITRGYPACSEEWLTKFNRVCKFYFGRRECIYTSDPDIVRDIITKHYKSFYNRADQAYVNRFNLKGLVFGKDAYWASARSVMMPLYHGEKLPTYRPLIMECISVLVRRLSKHGGTGKVIDITGFIQAMTVDIIGQVAFGMDFGAQGEEGSAQSELARKMADVVSSTTKLRTSILAFFLVSAKAGLIAQEILKRVPYTMEAKVHNDWQWLMKKASALVEQRRSVEGEAGGADLLSCLARAKTKDTQQALTPFEVAALAAETMLAGSDTSSNTIAHCIFLLAQNPDQQAKLLKELDEQGPLEKSGADLNDLSRYTYVEQVAKEAMRLYPTGAAIVRKANEDVLVKKVPFPKGSEVLVSIYAMHRDPAFFPNPESFIPERFDPTSEEAKQRHPYAYLPFGGGPRMCVGYRLALEEIKLTLIRVYENVTFKLDETKMGPPGTPLAIDAGIVLKAKNGIWVTVESRSHT